MLQTVKLCKPLQSGLLFSSYKEMEDMCSSCISNGNMVQSGQYKLRDCRIGDCVKSSLSKQEENTALNHNMRRKKQNYIVIYYEIMHGERKVAEISTRGEAVIFNERFMPYDLYLEEDRDFDTCINNMNNFYHWCAARVLSLDRKYAKEILNSIGMAQVMTDRDRAEISLSYHCVSLTDIYWVKKSQEELSFERINLYENSLNEAVVELSLRGKPMTVTNQELAPDLSTRGCFPKAWIRRENDFILLKDGGEDTVKRELVASRLCQCFDFKQVKYNEGFYDGQKVTESRLITSQKYSIISKMTFEIYALNHDLDVLEECLRVDKETYYGMNILDYLVGNIDRHPENWGFMVDNQTNDYISLYPIMDFNQSFGSYDTIDGANCQTVYPQRKTQREAAIEAVKNIGLHQIAEIDDSFFEGEEEWKTMFFQRLEELKTAVKE